MCSQKKAQANKRIANTQPGQCPELAQQLQRFSMILAMQSTQLAACNRLHEIGERLARWLLMSQDRIGGQTLPLTQEFLGQMLGTRRSSVSVAASILQKAGMIRYTRGSVTILNKSKLGEAACVPPRSFCDMLCSQRG